MYFNPTGKRLHQEAIIVSRTGGTPPAGNRIYLPPIPVVDSMQLVGLTCFLSVDGVKDVPPDISQNTVIPITAITLNPETASYMYLTIVNKSGEAIFQNLPLSLLFPYKGKIHNFYAVDIDTNRSYFSLAAGTGITGDVVVNLGFYLQEHGI